MHGLLRTLGSLHIPFQLPLPAKRPDPGCSIRREYVQAAQQQSGASDPPFADVMSIPLPVTSETISSDNPARWWWERKQKSRVVEAGAIIPKMVEQIQFLLSTGRAIRSADEQDYP